MVRFVVVEPTTVTRPPRRLVPTTTTVLPSGVVASAPGALATPLAVMAVPAVVPVIGRTAFCPFCAT